MIRKKILDCGRDSKQLFSIVNVITNNKQINPLPDNKSHGKMADDFPDSSLERYKHKGMNSAVPMNSNLKSIIYHN